MYADPNFCCCALPNAAEAALKAGLAAQAAGACFNDAVREGLPRKVALRVAFAAGAAAGEDHLICNHLAPAQSLRSEIELLQIFDNKMLCGRLRHLAFTNF